MSFKMRYFLKNFLRTKLNKLQYLNPWMTFQESLTLWDEANASFWQAGPDHRNEDSLVD